MPRSSSSALRPHVCRAPLRLLPGSAVLPPTSGQPWTVEAACCARGASVRSVYYIRCRISRIARLSRGWSRRHRATAVEALWRGYGETKRRRRLGGYVS